MDWGLKWEGFVREDLKERGLTFYGTKDIGGLRGMLRSFLAFSYFLVIDFLSYID